MLRALFGERLGYVLKTADGRTLTLAEAPPAWQERIEVLHWREQEHCAFAASGKVCLADGSERQFEVAWSMSRSKAGGRLTLGDGLRDPLVVDLAPPGAQLSTQRVSLDLDGDGRLESLRLPATGSALLFDDRNGNGLADDGSELFGPRTGNGFAELARLDDDGNGWIDERDTAFTRLKLWQIDAQGQTDIQPLGQASVGALAVNHIAIPYTLKEGDAIVGQVRASSVWLGEHGGAGSVRQIDIALSPTADETSA